MIFIRSQRDLKWKVKIGGCSVQPWHFWHIFVPTNFFPLLLAGALRQNISNNFCLYILVFLCIFWQVDLIKIYLTTFVFIFCNLGFSIYILTSRLDQNISDNFYLHILKHGFLSEYIWPYFFKFCSFLLDEKNTTSKSAIEYFQMLFFEWSTWSENICILLSWRKKTTVEIEWHFYGPLLKPVIGVLRASTRSWVERRNCVYKL